MIQHIRHFTLFFSLLICLFSQQTSAQTLTGVVKDEKGEPLPYATVYIRNTSNGTVANGQGEYKLVTDLGKKEVVFQYLGYRQLIKSVEVKTGKTQLDAQLEPADLELAEVVITTEDPAVRIMRKVIEQRKYFRDRMQDHSCDAYIKGLYRFMDAPKKIMGRDLGNMGGMLDTNRQGIVYLSESVSKVYSQKNPRKTKEVMISSKVSGSSDGFSLNRATLTDFNLYEERLNVERDLLSPLADNAFNYYNFKLLGKYKDENGYPIYKIKVIPKRPADPVFFGTIEVVDEQWNLAAADLSATGDAIKQPVLDTLRIQQTFVPIEKPDKWALLTQITSFKFGLLGFKIGGFFNGVFSNYDLKPQFGKKFFDREEYRIDDNASEKDSLYWLSIRPVPLTSEESRDYTKKDSLQRIWKSETFRDSMDHKNNKLKPIDLLAGYTWNNSYEHVEWSFPGLLRWIQFNTVQGLVMNFEPSWEKTTDKSTRFWRVKGNLNYGFSEEKLRGGLRFQRRFESIYYKTLTLEGGIKTEQFNPANPIEVPLNTAYSLLGRRNFMKIYEKRFVSGTFSGVAGPGWHLLGNVEWAERNMLQNTTDYAFASREQGPYTPNAPLALPEFQNPSFYTAFTLGFEARLRIGETYSSFPKYREYNGSKWPEITLRYRKAIPGVLGSEANYDFVQAQVRQSNLSWGLGGYTEWQLSGGAFLNDRRMSFMDRYQPIGNQTFIGKPDAYRRSFLLMPYYDYATDNAYAELHAQHHLQGWLLDKIPGIRRLNWKEVFGGGVYYADKIAADALEPHEAPYWEVNFGFENIGWKAFRMFRLDVAAGFEKGEMKRTGIVLGIGL